MPTSPMSPAAATSYLTRTEGRVANDIDGAGPLVVLVPGPGDLRGQVIMVPEAGHYPNRDALTPPPPRWFASPTR
jgi:hypothetical protein